MPASTPGSPRSRCGCARCRRPVLRAELLLDPVLATAEVMRMPAGSNPSYLDREQYAALRAAYLPAPGNA